MILRRVIRHVQTQNWTAVVIDFVIVVVGVYIGIQAQAWHTERDNRAIEHQYLLSLHEQLAKMIEDSEDFVVAARDRLAAFSEVTANFEVPSESFQLGLRHCRAITRSHIYVGQVIVPPTIEELLTTGRLQLIRDAEMRLTIVSYSQALESIRQLNYDIQADRVVLSRRYPDLITLGLQDQDEVTCDFDAMRRSEAFLNDLADNGYRHKAYVRDVVIGQRDLRASLHAMLDRYLGFVHPDSTAGKSSET
jgi:hypothetical protein